MEKHAYQVRVRGASLAIDHSIKKNLYNVPNMYKELLLIILEKGQLLLAAQQNNSYIPSMLQFKGLEPELM